MQCWSGYILIGPVGVVICCYVTTLTSQSQSSTTFYLGTLQKSLLGDAWEAPTFCHYFERDSDLANLPMKGSQILATLTRTNVTDENLKVSTPTSDDFWMVPYQVYLFIAKLPVWFTWDKTSHVNLSHFGVCLLD